MSLFAAILLVPCTGAAQSPAQETSGGSLLIVPSVGFGYLIDGGDLESAGMSVLLEVGSSGADYRWQAFAAIRGIGVGCSAAVEASHGSSEDCGPGGESFGAEVVRQFGRAGVGAGIGMLHREAGWSVQPHGKLTVWPGRFQVQLRLELSDGLDEIHAPMLVGLRLPVG